MTLEQLRIFVAVAERQNMTRASEALGMVQSAVSSAIATLERQHGVTLFHRIGRRIQLTDEGRIFLEEAKAVLSRASTAELTLTELGGLRAGVLTIHASQTIASYWLPKYLVRFREKYPKVSIRLSIGNTAQVAKAVVGGDADLGFVEGQVSDPMINDEIIEGDHLIVVVGSQHPWTKRKQIEPRDLPESDWVLREPGSGTRSEFEEALSALGISLSELRLALELPSNEAVRAAVEAGSAATATSELVAASGFTLGTLHKINIDLPARAFHVLRHHQRYRSKAAKALLDLISEEN